MIEVDVKDYDSYQQPVTLTGSGQRGISIFLTRPMAARQIESPVRGHGP